jgi:AbiU2
MGDYMTSDEIRAESVAKMGEALGNIRYELNNQIELLHVRWKPYRELFGTSPGTIALLNATAPAFFYDLEHIMWEDVLLHFCSVTDREQTMGKDNLTIQRIPPLADVAVKHELKGLVDLAVDKTGFARDWRNRRLPHTALPPLPGEIAKPLATTSRQHVEDALAALRAVMNCVESHYLGCPVRYEHAIEPPGGVAYLLACLQRGREARERHFRDAGVPAY